MADKKKHDYKVWIRDGFTVPIRATGYQIDTQGGLFFPNAGYFARGSWEYVIRA